MFYVQALHLETGEMESGKLDLVPKVAEGEKICGLFADWLGGQPAAFQAKIPFLKKGDVELQWNAAAGGVAYASLVENGEPLSLSVLLAGVDAEADAGMLDGFLGLLPDGLFQPAKERPLLATLVFPGRPEATPLLQLLTTALASVFFRTVFALRAGTAGN